MEPLWILAVKYSEVGEWHVHAGTAKETADHRDLLIGAPTYGMLRARVDEVYGFRNTALLGERSSL